MNQTGQAAAKVGETGSLNSMTREEFESLHGIEAQRMVEKHEARLGGTAEEAYAVAHGIIAKVVLGFGNNSPSLLSLKANCFGHHGLFVHAKDNIETAIENYSGS